MYKLKYSKLFELVQKRFYQTSESGVYGYRPKKPKTLFKGNKIFFLSGELLSYLFNFLLSEKEI